MKLFLSAIMFAGIFSAGAATVMINDFESGKSDGWGPYSDQEKPGTVVIADDTVSGDNAAKVTLESCKQYRGVQYFLAPKMPPDTVAVTFLIKSISGPPPSNLALAETPERYGKRLVSARADFDAKGNDWQKVRVPLSDMIYDSQGPDYEKPFSAFKPGAIYTVFFYVPVSDQRSVFLLDDIAWETK